MKKLLILAVIGIPISACSTTKYVATSAPFKSSVKPICIDDADRFTEKTGQAIEADNLAMRSINKSRDECPKQPKAKPTS